MTVVGVARGDAWTVLVADAVKGRPVGKDTIYDVLTDKIARAGDSYLTVVGNELILRAAQIVVGWRDPAVTNLADRTVFDCVLQTASTMRRLLVLKRESVAPQGATLVVCSPTAAFLWDARLDVNTFRRCRDFAVDVPDGQAAVLYGGGLQWSSAPSDMNAALDHLRGRILETDAAARAKTPPEALPYDLVDRWSSVGLRSGHPPARRRPFDNIDELLLNDFEATDAVLTRNAVPG
jgi:hypothetical protein